MGEFLWIQLVEGKRVRDPYSQHVLELGKPYKVRPVSFWLRRIESGDLKIVSDPEAKAAEPKKKKEKAGE